MLKVKISKIGLMILTSVFCLILSGVAAEKECWDSLGGGPTFTGNHNYPSGWFPEFQYDPNNPDEIDRNSSVEIKVIGGTPPYTWEVSGTGFSIPSSTTGRTNTLSADDTACGTATITVTDNYGVPVTGYVRCTTGQWVFKQHGCIMPGAGTEVDSGSGPPWVTYEYIDGYRRQIQTSYWMGVGNYLNCSMRDCCSSCDSGDCSEVSCQECVGDGRIPCLNEPTEALPDRSSCWKNLNPDYYEWECP